MVSSFETNDYSPEKTNAKAKQSLGVEIDGSYIGFHNINNLALYACNASQIPTKIQKSYLKWLHNYDGAIGYTNTRPGYISKTSGPARIVDLLSKFDGFDEVFAD